MDMCRRILVLCLLCASAFAKADDPFVVRVLPAAAGDASVEAVTSGRLDHEFTEFDYREVRGRGTPFWLRLEPRSGAEHPAGSWSPGACSRS